MPGIATVLSLVLTVATATVAGQTRDNPVRAGYDIPPPRRIKDVRPVYPEAAKKKGLRGVVILEITIAPDGYVAEVDVVRPVELLTGEAVVAAMQWQYEPPTVRNKPVWMRVTVTVSFPPPDPRRRAPSNRPSAPRV